MSAPDDRQPESGDASHFDFDDLVLDEEFVRAATISEASATARVERKREQQVRRSSRFPRPQWRRLKQGMRNWTSARPDDRRTRPAPEAPGVREWSAAQWAAVVVVLALAATFVWLLTSTGSKSHSSNGATAAITSVATPQGADTVGSCRGIQGVQIAAGVVPCTAPHSVEITGYTPLAGQTVPGSAPTSVEKSCKRSALVYAGGPLPSTVKSGVILPTAGQWSSGDHNAECTLYQVDNAGALVPTTGTLHNSEN